MRKFIVSLGYVDLALNSPDDLTLLMAILENARPITRNGAWNGPFTYCTPDHQDTQTYENMLNIRYEKIETPPEDAERNVAERNVDATRELS